MLSTTITCCPAYSFSAEKRMDVVKSLQRGLELFEVGDGRLVRYDDRQESGNALQELAKGGDEHGFVLAPGAAGDDDLPAFRRRAPGIRCRWRASALRVETWSNRVSPIAATVGCVRRTARTPRGRRRTRSGCASASCRRGDGSRARPGCSLGDCFRMVALAIMDGDAAAAQFPEVVGPDVVPDEHRRVRADEVEKLPRIPAGIEREVRRHLGERMLPGVLVSGRGEERHDDSYVRVAAAQLGDDRPRLLELAHRGSVEPDALPRARPSRRRRERVEQSPPPAHAAANLAIHERQEMERDPEGGKG